MGKTLGADAFAGHLADFTGDKDQRHKLTMVQKK
jgi:hypothetical protein